MVAFGEIGLDYHYDFSPREIQREVFIEQLKLARELNLAHHHPHARSLGRHHVDPRRPLARSRHHALLHRRRPTRPQQALDLGFHLAFGGVLTFKTAENVREAARITPDDRLLIETDAPFLAPIPYRGKRNEPSMMIETLKKLAEIRGTTPEQIAELTTANFERLCLRHESDPLH